MLRRVRIQRYKSLRDVDVALQPLSVLFGPNAAGKSNFLDALQLLSRIASSRSLKEAFEPPYRGNPLESFSFGPGGMEKLLEESEASFRIEADIELSQDAIDRVEREIREFRSTGDRELSAGAPKPSARKRKYVRDTYLRYCIEVEVLPRSGMLRLRDESLAALRKDGQPKQSRNPFLERMKGKLHLRMEKQSHPMQFEVGLDHAIISRPLYAPHYPHLLAAKYELQSWLFFYFEPRERMRVANAVKEVRHLGLMGEDLAAFLNTLRASAPRQFKAVEKGLQQIVKRVRGIGVDVNKLGEVELSLLEGDSNTPIPARLVSEGTLRVLGLLAAASSSAHPGLIGLEEPENGIHPRRIELIAEYLKTRVRIGRSQIIATTHSPVLLDRIPAEHLYVFRRKDSATDVSRFESWGPLGKAAQIGDALKEPGDGVPLSVRLLRGDFDDG